MGIDITDPKVWKGGRSKKGKKPSKSGIHGDSLKAVHRHGGDFFTGIAGKKGHNIYKAKKLH